MTGHQAVRPASTVLALRGGGAGFEVLMVRRAGGSAFMGGAYVFPGGAIDAVDCGPAAAAAVAGGDAEQHPWWAAGLRELAEEAAVLVTTPPAGNRLASELVGRHGADLYADVVAAGLRFDGDRLGYVSNWVTPPGPPRRFDTRFYVVEVPAGTPAVADGHEVTEAVWIAPGAALARDGAGWHVPFPTRWHLRWLAGHDSAAAAVAAARAQVTVPQVAPRVVRDGDGHRVLLPGDPGFADAAAGPA